MKITDLKIGDCVCSPRDKFPMTVVGLYSTLEELAQGKGTVYLDFDSNEGDTWEVELPEDGLEFYKQNNLKKRLMRQRMY